jgi:UDP-glucose 4-epimerase
MGFIGRNLCELLLSEGYDVHAIDDYTTSEFRQPIVLREIPVKFHQETILNYKGLLDIFDGAKYVFHLAANPRIEPSKKNPVLFNKINVEGSLNVFLAAAEVEAEKVVFSSSSSIYGEPENLPTLEEDKKDPMSPYALQKLICEEYLELFHKLYGLDSVSLRYFNVYGKYQPSQGPYVPVIGIFFRQSSANHSLTIIGDGEQRRDFVHVSDVCRANLLAARTDLGKSGHRAVNVGTGTDCSVNDIADAVGGNKINLDPRFEPRNTLANISKIKELLNWEPTVSVLDWIKENKP